MKLLLRRTLVLPNCLFSIKHIVVFVLVCLSLQLSAQQTDSLQNISDTASLQNVRVTAFASQLKWKDVPASIAILTKQNLLRYDGASLVSAMNTVAGVRMEERSPGSYRLSIRGSLLRSPFGVRNIKIYIDDVPLTDATGNTYLNLVDPNHLQSAEIIKGPSSSFYGANTGGALLLHNDATLSSKTNSFSAGLSGGSFGMFNEEAGWKYGNKKFVSNLQQGHLQNDGYRQQSALRRDVLQWNGKWSMSAKETISFFAFYSNLHYETPGGINKKQMDSLPTLARQPAGSLPGAVQQNAGIYNKTGFAAVTLHSDFGNGFGNSSSVVANHTDYKNPFITNYEMRNEWNYSARTDFYYTKEGKGIKLKADAGAELQYGTSHVDVYGNKAGVADTVQYKDFIKATQYFLFAQVNLTIGKKLLLQAGISNNDLRYKYERTTDPLGDYPVIKKSGPTTSPRFGVSYAVAKEVSLYGTIAKGFSPPTLAEILPSAGEFTADLQPEYGWNYEAGIKGAVLNNRLEFNASFYYFELKDAIVRRVNEIGADYFVNAGGTIQKGVEVWLNGHIINSETGFIRSLNVWNSFAYQPYRFDDYVLGSVSYSGNKLTGVPRTVNVTGLDIKTKGNYFLNITFNYTSALPLNDANTYEAEPYHLLQCRIGKDFILGAAKLKLFAGVDNLLNEVYSLGNDINAAGNPPRFYNPAPKINCYAGASITF